MSWASESGRAMFPFDEMGRTLATNTVAGARAIVARAESYDRVPDIGQSRKYSTVSPPWRNRSVSNWPTLEFASSAYAIRANRPGRARRACSRPPTSRTSVRERTATSLAASWNRLLPTTCGIESSGTVRRSNRPSRRLISSMRRTDWASRSGVIRPAATAAVMAARAESGSAGMSSRSEPARNARTVASPAPYLATIAPIVSASVTTRPGKRRESRSSPVRTAADNVPGSLDPVSAGNAMCALITTSAPAAMQARNRAGVLAERADIDERVRRVVVDVGIGGEIDVDADGPALDARGRADRI